MARIPVGPPRRRTPGEPSNLERSRQLRMTPDARVTTVIHVISRAQDACYVQSLAR
jgi:hypothetical protein